MCADVKTFYCIQDYTNCKHYQTRLKIANQAENKQKPIIL